MLPIKPAAPVTKVVKIGQLLLGASQPQWIEGRSAEEDQADQGRNIPLEEDNRPPIDGFRAALPDSERKSRGPSVVVEHCYRVERVVPEIPTDE